YAEIETDDRDRLDVPLLGLMIGLRDNRVACWDLRTHEELGNYAGVVHELAEAKRLLEAADHRAEQQEQEMEVQVTARQNAERQAADAQKVADSQRQEADKQKKEADRQREETERAQKEADRQRQEADTQREEADRQRQEAEKQRRAREAAD